MCLLALWYRAVHDAPVLVAANREERFDRPAAPPQLQPGPPRVLCGVDREAGGTWLGVNEHGLLVAVTNRSAPPPPSPRSRGVLCRELLACRGAAEATARAEAELASGRYAGCNLLCVDADHGSVVSGGARLQRTDLEPGLHLLTNGDLNDEADPRQSVARARLGPRPPDSARDFVTLAATVCGDPAIVVRAGHGGTVSSQLVALTELPRDAIYMHAEGPPDEHPYDDYSSLLRELAARFREK